MALSKVTFQSLYDINLCTDTSLPVVKYWYSAVYICTCFLAIFSSVNWLFQNNAAVERHRKSKCRLITVIQYILNFVGYNRFSTDEFYFMLICFIRLKSICRQIFYGGWYAVYLSYCKYIVYICCYLLRKSGHLWL